MRTLALVPESLTPRLPTDFTGRAPLAKADARAEAGAGVGAEAGAGVGAEAGAGVGAGASLIVFSGLPGTGESTLADATGRELGIPVFAADWLLGSLTPFGGYHLDGLLDISVEMLTKLAHRQLRLGQSAILDHPAEDLAARFRWRTHAEAAGVKFRAVECTCSDPEVHRARLERRARGIPGADQESARRGDRGPRWRGDRASGVLDAWDHPAGKWRRAWPRARWTGCSPRRAPPTHGT